VKAGMLPEIVGDSEYEKHTRLTWWQRHRGSIWWCKWYGSDPNHPDEPNYWAIGFIAPLIHRNFTVVFVPEALYVEVWVSQNIWTQWRAEYESIRDTYHWKFGGI